MSYKWVKDNFVKNNINEIIKKKTSNIFHYNSNHINMQSKNMSILQTHIETIIRIFYSIIFKQDGK